MFSLLKTAPEGYCFNDVSETKALQKEVKKRKRNCRDLHTAKSC